MIAMVENERQLMISKGKVIELSEAIERINNNPKKDPLIKELLTASLIMAKEEIEQEILFYETLKKDKEGILKERLFSELPTLLTEYKIKSGLTQKEFAEQLGIKEQQLQRYEADNFKSVTFKNLLRFLDAIGLEIMIKETRMTRTNKKSTRKKQSSR
jgi:HTH-type transcriptional regulator / antitoxin HipB